MTLETALTLIGGLALLVLGAEILVSSASRLGKSIGVSPLVIGLTVVAFGTSAPELAVSVQASLGGQGGLALGNVVGSNMFNTLAILGVSALITPLVVQAQLVRFDVLIMIGASFGVLALGWDGSVSRPNGLLLLVGMACYLFALLRLARRAPNHGPKEATVARPLSLPTVARDLALIAGGLVLLVLGSDLFVQSAVQVATALKVSELVIGVTLVAAGTSLPEAATSLLAAFRGQRDIAVGNVVGSNIFNLLVVLGMSAAVSPSGLLVTDSVRSIDLPLMALGALVCLPVFLSGLMIARWEGGLFLIYYLAYLSYVVLAARGQDLEQTWKILSLGVVLPATLVVIVLAALRRARPKLPNV